MPGETSSSSMSISTAEITNACNNRIPVLKSTEIKEYLRWRKSIDVWLRITKLDKNEQGACILINALDDVKAKDIAYTIEITDLEKDNGAELLLKLLDDQFKDKEEDKVRKAYKNWKGCAKKEDITFAEYGSRMTILFRELEAADIKLGKKAKAHVLIAESGIPEEEKFKMERLVKDASDDK